MTRLEPAAYLAHIRSESARLREVLAGADPSTPVPTCPGWSADDLLWHFAGVEHWWSWLVRHRPHRTDQGYDDPVRPGDHRGLLAFHDEHAERLLDALAGLSDPAEEVWTWSHDHTAGFVLRRQAQEAVVHRHDAERTVGAITALPGELAADGVQEVLDLMFGARPGWATFTPDGHHVEVRPSDAGEPVRVVLGRLVGTDRSGTLHDRDHLRVVADPGVPADAVLEGPAQALDLWLWGRSAGEDVAASGDPGTVQRFRAIVDEPVG